MGKKPAAPAKKNRLLQALKVKAGGKVKGGVKAKVGVKVPKVGVKAKIGGKAKVGGKAKLHVKIGAPKIAGGFSFGAKGGAKGKAKGGLKMKVKVHKMKITYKLKAGYENKVAPKDFLKGTTCRASFEKAYQGVYTVNHDRKLTQFLGKKCFRQVVRMRGELSCAACDNTKEKFFTDASKLALKASDVQNLGFCVQFMAKFNSYKTLLGDMLAFAATMKIDTKAAQAKLDALKWSTDANCASGATPAAPAKKDGKKPATPAKKDDKKPSTPAKKAIKNQLPV